MVAPKKTLQEGGRLVEWPLINQSKTSGYWVTSSFLHWGIVHIEFTYF